jgi:hypothetical protein
MLTGIGALLMWGRCVRYFSYSEDLGPKVYMSTVMLGKDIKVFMQLLLVVMLGYGVAAIAVESPYRDWHQTTIWVRVCLFLWHRQCQVA